MAPLDLDDDVLRAIEAVGADERASALLGSLPADQAAAIHGRVVEEEPYADLAGRLRCSEAAVRKRVSRGLLNLHRLLKEHP